MATNKARTPVLGVDPELVLVLELNRQVDPDQVRRAELAVLELSGEKVLVAFASDPELTEFRNRCEAYQQGTRPPLEVGQSERAAEYEDLFDAVDKIRPLAAQDIISAELSRVLDDTPPQQALRLDVQCWCPEGESEARRRHEEVVSAVASAGGAVLDKSLREPAGLSLVRVDLPASMVYQLAQVDRVKSIDVLPRPVLTHPQVWSASPDSLPVTHPPSPAASTVAVIDSGVRSAHPMLAPAVIGAEAVGLGDGGDESGHGTLAQGVRPVRDQVDVVPMGGPGRPSPVTRTGPGVARMIKPELAMPGGSWGVNELERRLVDDRTLSVVGAGGLQADRLLTWDVGTSYATPLVSHVALRVLERYPFLSANGVRALILASVNKLEPVVDGPGQGARAEQARLTGYGRPSAERAEASDDHRAVLFAENEIDIDGVHLYRVPLPTTFFESGGTRTVAVALAYDPEVRPTRLDYLASRMAVDAYRGAPSEAVARAYAEIGPTDPDPADRSEPAAPAEIRQYLVDLQPANSRRGRGANQYASVTFGHRLREKGERELILAVRNFNKWATPGDRQRYAIAVVLERDVDHGPLYEELRAELGLLAEVELEVG